MLAKQYRLTGKDIQYMLRKGKKIYGNILVFVVVPQYRQRRYIQRSVQIPVKLDKRAVMRNLLKRAAKALFVDMLPDDEMHYKVFVFVNKKSLDDIKDTIATQKKTAIVAKRKEMCKKDFTLFFSRVGATLSTASSPSSNKGRNSGVRGKRSR